MNDKCIRHTNLAQQLRERHRRLGRHAVRRAALAVAAALLQACSTAPALPPVPSAPAAVLSIYLKAAKDHGAIFFYASQDGRKWEIVRKFNLDSSDGLWVGFSAQSPDGEGATARFTNVRYSGGPVNLWDLR